jgi:hypothetical protein
MYSSSLSYQIPQSLNQPRSIRPTGQAHSMNGHCPCNASSEGSPSLHVVTSHQIITWHAAKHIVSPQHNRQADLDGFLCSPWRKDSISHGTKVENSLQNSVVSSKSADQACKSKKGWFMWRSSPTLNLERLGTPNGANVANSSTRKRQFWSNSAAAAWSRKQCSLLMQHPFDCSFHINSQGTASALWGPLTSNSKTRFSCNALQTICFLKLKKQTNTTSFS